jgi:predicted membrane protein
MADSVVNGLLNPLGPYWALPIGPYTALYRALYRETTLYAFVTTLSRVFLNKLIKSLLKQPYMLL